MKKKNKLKTSFVMFLILSIFIDVGTAQNLKHHNNNEVWAVATGHNVQFSTCWGSNHQNYYLDYALGGVGDSWSTRYNRVGEWIQVSSQVPKLWTSVTTQGRKDYDQWVSSYKVAYTTDGRQWIWVDDGRHFNGNSDRNTKITNKFQTPVTARVIRIFPQTWHGHISLRFDVRYIEE